MANAVTKIPFSASTSGKGILIPQTATPGTPIHVTGNIASIIDEFWLWFINSHTADILVTVEFGGVTSPGNVIVLNVPFNQGLVIAVPGLPMVQGGGALTVAAFAAVANKVAAFGFVNRITP